MTYDYRQIFQDLRESMLSNGLDAYDKEIIDGLDDDNDDYRSRLSQYLSELHSLLLVLSGTTHDEVVRRLASEVDEGSITEIMIELSRLQQDTHERFLRFERRPELDAVAVRVRDIANTLDLEISRGIDPPGRGWERER